MTPQAPTHYESLEQTGAVLLKDAIHPALALRIAHALGKHGATAPGPGARHLEILRPLLADVLRLPQVESLAKLAVGPMAKIVRTVSFYKTRAANWFVPWHQDVTVALRRRGHAAGFTNWTLKNGVPHAEAPVALLESMLLVRLHLDPAGIGTGGLEVVPASHRLGRIRTAETKGAIRQRGTHAISAEAGDIVAMRPLLLHRSMRLQNAVRRRVIQLELAPEGSLPEPLQWFEAGCQGRP